MAKTKKKRKKKQSSSGLSPQTFKGLSKKRMKKGSGGPGRRVQIKQGDTIPVQFLERPEDFIEFEMHNFQEEGRWQYIPCAGDGCPLCEDESGKRSKTSYRFACNVINMQNGRVQVLEGPKDLAGRIYYKYERKKGAFLKRVWDISKFPTSPVSYAVDRAEQRPKNPKGLELHDLTEYLIDEMKRYYGEDLSAVADSLTEEEDLDDLLDEEDWEEDEFEDWDDDIDDVDWDEDEDEEDEELDEDEEEDDDPLDVFEEGDEDDLEDWEDLDDEEWDDLEELVDEEDEDFDDEEDEDEEEGYTEEELEDMSRKQILKIAKDLGLTRVKGKRTNTYIAEILATQE